MKAPHELTLGLAQISPVWLNREKTLEKVNEYVSDAASRGCELVAFGEALLPGYPFWVELTQGANFNDPLQKEFFRRYAEAAVIPERGDLDSLKAICKDKKVAVYLGTIERAQNHGAHSLYCTMIYIDQEGEIQSTHRKLRPTHEERLVWSPGDGHGLRVHPLKDFTVGGLNCWENWMPLSRTALYGQGEDLHVAIWPGSYRNTHDITQFMAREGRSFVMSVSGYFTREDIPDDFPEAAAMKERAPEILADGGSCLAAPDGSWVIDPSETTNREGLFVGTVDHGKVLEERQNFDPVGHYSRPDVTRLVVNQERQQVVRFE